MTILVVGASGATGQLLVQQLLARKQSVKIIVRSQDNLSEDIKGHPLLSVITASILDLSDAQMVEHVSGCTAVASCLGHQLSLRGIYGQPRRLVTEAVRRLCDAIVAAQSTSTVRFVLMNTTGNRNRDLDEPISMGQHCVIGLLRLLLPPHVDNEQAADFLRAETGNNGAAIEWAAVRPDSLTNDREVTEYDTHPSPIRSAIFDSGQTSRINVAHFMAELITDDDIWHQWQGQMPVIYNRQPA